MRGKGAAGIGRGAGDLFLSPLFLLMVYAKAAREDVAPEAKKALAEFAARIKRGGRG